MVAVDPAQGASALRARCGDGIEDPVTATDRDRETAKTLLREHFALDSSTGTWRPRGDVADAIAAALAAERERVLAPVLAALDALSRETGAYEAGYKSWAQTVIREVRQAARSLVVTTDPPRKK